MGYHQFDILGDIDLFKFNEVSYVANTTSRVLKIQAQNTKKKKEKMGNRDRYQ